MVGATVDIVCLFLVWGRGVPLSDQWPVCFIARCSEVVSTGQVSAMGHTHTPSLSAMGDGIRVSVSSAHNAVPR